MIYYVTMIKRDGSKIDVQTFTSQREAEYFKSAIVRHFGTDWDVVSTCAGITF